MKDKVIGFLTSIAGTIFSFSIPFIYFLGLYHSYNEHPSKDLMLSIFVPPWGFYRGIEIFWHVEEDKYSETKIIQPTSRKEEKTGSDKWIMYNSPSKDFSIDLPMSPEVKQENLSGMEISTYNAIGNDFRIILAIDVIKIPSGLNIDFDKAIEMYRDTNNLENFTEEKTDQTWTLIGDVSEQSANKEELKIIKWAKNGKGKIVLTQIGNTIYARKAIYDGSLDKEIVDRFFDSFQIIPK